MEEQAFRDVLSKHLLGMFAGTELGGKTIPSSPRHKIVALDTPVKLLMKPDSSAKYRVQLCRSQPFTSEEQTLVTLFVSALGDVVKLEEAAFFPDLLAGLPRTTISAFLPPKKARTTFASALKQFEEFASQTYEGRPVVLALGLTGSVNYGAIGLQELWREDFAKVLSNGFDSMYQAGSDGRVFTLECLPRALEVGYAPQRLGSIASWCERDSRVAMVLNRNGEILIFKNRQLQFAKRRGAWRYYPHDSVVQRLGVGTPAVRRAAYESCLDVSFARSGGCLAIVAARYASKIDKYVSEKDLIERKQGPRTKLLAYIAKKEFHRLDRRLRLELLSMDGATVLTHTGRLVTAGAIVTVPSGSPSGGRKAAAKALSKLGLAIKISADGPMEGFRAGKPIFAL